MKFNQIFSLFFIISIFVNSNFSMEPKINAEKKASIEEISYLRKLIETYITENDLCSFEKLYASGYLEKINFFEDVFLVAYKHLSLSKINLFTRILEIYLVKYGSKVDINFLKHIVNNVWFEIDEILFTLTHYLAVTDNVKLLSQLLKLNIIEDINLTTKLKSDIPQDNIIPQDKVEDHTKLFAKQQQYYQTEEAPMPDNWVPIIDSCSPIFLAAANNCHNSFDLLVKNKSDLFLKTPAGYNIVHIAVAYNADKTLIEKLISYVGTDLKKLINEKAEGRFTPIIISLVRRSASIVKLLFNAGDYVSHADLANFLEMVSSKNEKTEVLMNSFFAERVKDEACPICLEKFEHKDVELKQKSEFNKEDLNDFEYISLPCCSSPIHTNCLEQHRQSSHGSNNKCPKCRGYLPF